MSTNATQGEGRAPSLMSGSRLRCSPLSARTCCTASYQRSLCDARLASRRENDFLPDINWRT
jgi:hypothetical protein